MSTRGATALAGILLLDKAAGMTSHDVVAAIRRATGEGRVGHAGTLDPAATGLLVVLVGPYSRLAPYLSGASKRYEATIRFGSSTDTDDADGEVTADLPVPAEVFEPEHAQGVLAGFLGPSMQVPPAYSAIKSGGRAAHRAARSGNPLVLDSRPVEVYQAALLGVDPAECTWHVDLLVSKGTYVRALARDIGEACGTAAHLAALRRTASGPLRVENAHSLHEVEGAARQGTLDGLFTDALAALDLPTVEGPAAEVGHGRALAASLAGGAPDGALLAITAGGRLGAIYRRSGDSLVPQVVLAGGQS